MNGPIFAELEAEALPESEALEAVDTDTRVQRGWQADLPLEGSKPWRPGQLHGPRASLQDAARRIRRDCAENREPRAPPLELEWAVEGQHHRLRVPHDRVRTVQLGAQPLREAIMPRSAPASRNRLQDASH